MAVRFRTAVTSVVMSIVVTALALNAAACDKPHRSAAPAQSPDISSPVRISPSAPVSTPVRVEVAVRPELSAAPFDRPRSLDVPAGWTVSVVARIAKARFMATTPDGAVLVSQPDSGHIQLVQRQPDGGTKLTEYASGLTRPHDMVFAEVAGATWLYVAEADRVQRYPYVEGGDRIGPGEVVADGLPSVSLPELHGQYAHELKNIAVHNGRLYISIASTCNACASDTRSDPQRAAIYTYDAAGHNADRKLYATGLRNAEGLAFRPGTDDLWAVVNDRDNTLVPDDRDVTGDGKSDKGKRVTSFVDNYPVEPFTQVRQNAFYGWPFCNPNADHGRRGLGFDRDYELNRDGKAADCAKATPIDVGIDAHSAPLGLTFTQGTKAPDVGAVIPLHGSWNRSTPTGYKVICFPWTAAGPGDQRDLVTGWLDPSSGKAWGRPVDAAVDADGTLLISDDTANAIYRLTPKR